MTMRQMITATYTRGVLQPTQKLNLAEHETVHLWLVRPAEDIEQSEAARALGALRAAGLVQPPSGAPPADPVPAARRQELARILAEGGPLSEVIIEDREQR